jgi:phage protein D
MALALPAIERRIEIDGSELDADVDEQLERVEVVDRLAMPDTFVLQFRDPDRDVLTRGRLEIGKRLTISTTSPTDDGLATLISGEVTSIEADYDLLGTRTVVRGYDLSHRLTAGRKTATFQNVKLSDIASQIAREAGLESDVDDSGPTLEHVIQPNLCDLDFLYSLARRIGFDCRVEGDRLLFKRPTPSSSAPGEGDFESTDPMQLVWNHNLLEFRASMSAVAQVGEVKVRGWDVNAKKAVIGQADVSASNAEISMTPSDLAKKVGGKTLVVVDRPVVAQEPADEVARTKAEQVGSAAFEATAVVVGSPALKAGVAVNISNIEPALSGKWVISSSHHEFGSGAYRTVLEFSGSRDRSLHGVVTGGLPGRGLGASVFPGVVAAVVTDNDDPDSLGRVKVHYPWLSEDAESFWARVAMPGAGKEYGMVWLPQVGDEVLVAFVHGDFSHPVVLGGMWNGQDTPPLGEGLLDAGSVRRSGFVSRKGHMLVFFDGDDDAGIALLTADRKFRLSLNATSGQLHVAFDGDLLMDGSGNVEIKAGGSVMVEAGASMELKAGGNAVIKGAKVALNPPG